MTDDDLIQYLEQRVGRLHLRQRLGIETDHESQIFGQGLNFFHIENWYSMHVLMRLILRLLLLYERGRRNAMNIQVRQNIVPISGLPPAFHDFTILQLSDLHLDMRPELPQVMSEVVQGLDYDICVLTGDFRFSTHGSHADATNGMRLVKASLNRDVYGVLGNHDSIKMVPEMESMGIRVLMNESIKLERSGDIIHLVGVDDAHYYRLDNLEKACDGIPVEDISILLSHTPEIFRQATHAGFDLMLCGHTHGGQICLPGGKPIMTNAICPRWACKGVWRHKQMQGYTSVGSGSSVMDVRLNNLPEVTLHTLHCESDTNTLINNR